MKQRKFNKGFSLTEVLIAAGILVIGLMMILGTFPVGIKLTAVSTERTIGTVAANEAFDKVQLYGLDPVFLSSSSFRDAAIPFNYLNAGYIVSQDLKNLLISSGITTKSQREQYFQSRLLPDQFYPSSDYEDDEKYCWSVLLRSIGNGQVQITAFVCRKGAESLEYPVRRRDIISASGYFLGFQPWQANTSLIPVPVPVKVDIDPDLVLPDGSVDPEQLIDDSLYRPTYLESKREDAGQRVNKRYTDRIVLSVDSDYDDHVAARNRIASYFVPGAVMLDDYTGQLMVVKERQLNSDTNYPGDINRQKIILVRQPDQLKINQRFPSSKDSRRGDVPDVPGGLFEVYTATGNPLPGTRYVWLVPPAISDKTTAVLNMPPTVSGRNPCVGVYQRVVNY